MSQTTDIVKKTQTTYNYHQYNSNSGYVGENSSYVIKNNGNNNKGLKNLKMKEFSAQLHSKAKYSKQHKYLMSKDIYETRIKKELRPYLGKVRNRIQTYG